MRYKFAPVALLVCALSGCSFPLSPDFLRDVAKEIKVPEMPAVPLATKAEVPVDPVLLGTWTLGVKRGPAEADLVGVTPGFKLEAKSANEYLISPTGRNTDRQETAFLVQVGPYKILQVKNRAAKALAPWQFMRFAKLTQDETILGVPYKSGDLVCAVIFFVNVPQQNPAALAATYRGWIAACDFAKAEPGEHVRAMPLIFWPVKEQQEAEKK